MNFDSEISKVKSILRGKFASPSDKRYWEDKLAELESKKRNYEENVKYRKEYEKGVPAFKKV